MKYMKLGSKPDCFQTDGKNIRYVANELETDIVVTLREVKFYLHKFPILSKSARLQKLVAASNGESNDEFDLNDIPGGSAAFETCAKFCYGMVVALNAYNVVAARCAAEYLEMYETIDKGNLIYKIEVFLDTSIFRSWKDSIIVLQSTKHLAPLPDHLKIVSRSVESIASKASIDPSKVDWSYSYDRRKLPEENGNHSRRTVPKDWWVEDLCELEIDMYKQVVMCIASKGVVSNRVIGQALKAYAYRKIPGFNQSVVKDSNPVEVQSVVDMILTLLPLDKGTVSCSFLLKLLKTSIGVNSSNCTQAELIRRTGKQLDEASLSDLLIHAAHVGRGVYDVDVVYKLVEEFRWQGQIPEIDGEPKEVPTGMGILSDASKLMVTKLIDAYLAEIAKDSKLDLGKFIDLAKAVASFPRPSHDALYRAIDMYLQEHLGMTKADRKKICRLMDCKKLSSDACTHAVQNDRLPLRVIVQVLFFEQVRASASSGSSTPDLPKVIKDLNNTSGSNGSSKSLTTNTEDDWDGLASSEELKALKGEIASLSMLNGRGENERNVEEGGKASVTKAKGLIVSKKLFSRIWSSKHRQAESSSSEPSECGSGPPVQGEPKSTPSRSGRHSVS